MHLHEGVMPDTIRIGVSLVSAVFVAASCELIRCIFFDASPRGIHGKFSSSWRRYCYPSTREGWIRMKRERLGWLEVEISKSRLVYSCIEGIVNGDVFRSSRLVSS